jgi:hypothetical protein
MFSSSAYTVSPKNKKKEKRATSYLPHSHRLDCTAHSLVRVRMSSASAYIRMSAAAVRIRMSVERRR